MGVQTFETETVSVIPAAKLFKAVILDGDNLLSKVGVKGFSIVDVEILQGNGGPGTIKKITYGVGNQLNYVKHKVDSFDKESLSYSYTLFEGNTLSDKFEKITYEIKTVPSNGGFVTKAISNYYSKGDCVHPGDVPSLQRKGCRIVQGL